MKLSSNLLVSLSQCICIITLVISLCPMRSSTSNIGCRLSREFRNFYHESNDRRGCYARFRVNICDGHCESNTILKMNEFMGFIMNTQDGRCCRAQQYSIRRKEKVVFICPNSSPFVEEEVWYADARSCQCLHSS